MNPSMPATQTQSQHDYCSHWCQLLSREDWRLLVAMLVGAFSITLTSELAAITFGAWLSHEQDWDVASVGAATFAIGLR